MPISDSDSYPTGHFKRVYDFLIKPACEAAGFKPVRADDILNTNYIALDIVKNIIEADMALCDLSSKNPNVLYELGIRQAFNKPVTLIKDRVTQRIFDISGFRDIEYDESLRIDSVQSNIELIAGTMKNTFQTSGTEINSLVALLGIEPAKVERNISISPDTELIINSINNLDLRINELYTRFDRNQTPPIDLVSSIDNPNYITLEAARELNKGDRILHAKFGKGTVKKMEGTAINPIAVIDLDNGETKKFMTKYARFVKIQ